MNTEDFKKFDEMGPVYFLFHKLPELGVKDVPLSTIHETVKDCFTGITSRAFAKEFDEYGAQFKANNAQHIEAAGNARADIIGTLTTLSLGIDPSNPASSDRSAVERRLFEQQQLLEKTYRAMGDYNAAEKARRFKQPIEKLINDTVQQLDGLAAGLILGKGRAA